MDAFGAQGKASECQCHPNCSLPLNSTFVCPTEIIAFSDRIQEFRDINTEVIACSVDSPFTHLAW